MHRKARIVATLGPTSESPAMLEALIRAGVNVFRLNLSHGTQEQHAVNIHSAREIASRVGKAVGVLLDMQGPKIRVGELASPLVLSVGEKVCLAASAAAGCIPVEFPELFDMVRTGDRLLMDDGRLQLTVGEVEGQRLFAQVNVGGILESHKGINLPGVRITIPGFTAKDRLDLQFGLREDVDAVAISFVRSADDVRQVRQAIEENLLKGTRLPLLIAKLERPEALDNLEAILDSVDGVMVARGDLGVEVPPEQVPVLQKRIITAANQRAKIVITATQMLESMVHNPLPTRAEASDVANAIFDGTDAVMLSAETASGEYPLQSVEMMDRIVSEAEAHMEWSHGLSQTLPTAGDDATSMAYAARELANDVDVAGIAVFTASGKSAWVVSEVRPETSIFAFTPHIQTFRRLAFLWGVQPFLVRFADSLAVMLANLEEVARAEQILEPGQQTVVVCSYPVGELRPPNMALLYTVRGSA